MVRVHRDAATAGGDDQAAVVDEPGDRGEFHDGAGLGGGDDPAPGRSVLADGPAVLGPQPVRLVSRVGAADELRRVGERRVVQGDDGLGEHGDDLAAGEGAA
ncbi:hypothetical protein [Actinomadura geliboluensis]